MLVAVKGWYCGKDCQIEDWKRHKEWCKKKEAKHIKRQTNKFCWNCFSEPCVSKKLYRCAGCRKGWYCGEDCQFEDWKRHKEWCKKNNIKI